MLTAPQEINFKFILPLAMLYLMIYLAADSVAYKMVALGPTLEPGPPFIFPLSYVIGDIIAEVYGYKISKKIIWYTLLLQIIYSVIVTIIINLPSPKFWPLQSSYDNVFGHIIRFVLSGTVSILLSSFINVYIISKWKILLKGKYFWLRSIGASAIGGFILIFTIVVLGYTGSIHKDNIWKFFLSIYVLELMYAFLFSWPAWLLAGYLKLKEKIDVYDLNTNFNPFSFQ